MRRLLAGAASMCALLLVTGCVPATPDADTYRDKAQRTLGAGVSEATTVAKVLQTLDEDKNFRSSAITQVRDSQSAIDTAEGAFIELTGPAELEKLTTRTGTLMSDAGDVMDDARTAIEHRDTASYVPLADQLEKLATEMEKLEESLR